MQTSVRVPSLITQSPRLLTRRIIKICGSACSGWALELSDVFVSSIFNPKPCLCFPATLCAAGVRGFTRWGGGAGLAPQIKAFLQLGSGWRWIWGVCERPKLGTFPPRSPVPSHRGDSQGRPRHRACPSAPAATPRQSAAAARTLCPELLLPIATNLGKKGSGNSGNSKEVYPNYTERFFSQSQNFSFKRNKSCGCSVSWNLGCERGQETEFTPFGHPPSLPSTSIDLFLGHEVG